ncbi:MAG TPA: hypothetical protein VFC78_08915 [Tepidisphaeraceae bacterium]|nr:hypothetical protein [Tepidisphaeraceae bacterium]
MAEAGGHLWISQANSDWWAAARLFDPDEPRSFCQTIAKCQQTVEKSIKAIAAALQDRLIVSIPIGYKHDVADLASALRRLAKPRDPTDIQYHINILLTEYVLNEIKALDAMAPRRPSGGCLHARNTEYPFERIAGDWIAPSFAGVFALSEIYRFQQLAKRVYPGARAIVSALRR